MNQASRVGHSHSNFNLHQRGPVTHVLFNGDEQGYPGCTNMSFEYVEGESLLMALKDVCLSSGSACTSASLEPSYVLRSLGLNDEK